MSAPQLSVVRIDDQSESPAGRTHRLYAEAQRAALEHVRTLEESLSATISLAAEIAEGGDVYPAGVRDLCRRLGDDLSLRSQTLEALAQRSFDQR